VSNNRLYIVNSRTGARLFLAKSNSPIGWRLACSPAEFDVWMVGVDMSSVEGEEETCLMLDTDVTEKISS
jgi:hypothetical protein